MIIIKNKATKGVFTKSKLTNVKGGRASYKSDDEYLKAVYNKNRKRFEGNDAFKDPLRTPYQLFKLNINDLTQNYGVSDVEEAVRIMGRREYFYESKEARFTAQSYVDIRADKKFFKHLRKLYKERINISLRSLLIMTLSIKYSIYTILTNKVGEYILIFPINRNIKMKLTNGCGQFYETNRY